MEPTARNPASFNDHDCPSAAFDRCLYQFGSGPATADSEFPFDSKGIEDRNALCECDDFLGLLDGFDGDIPAGYERVNKTGEQMLMHEDNDDPARIELSQDTRLLDCEGAHIGAVGADHNWVTHAALPTW